MTRLPMPPPAMLALAMLVLALLALVLPARASADPADVNAAARGVVRVVVIGRDGEEIFPLSHGTGFAVGPETIVTNAHVVAEALADPELSLGIVPSDGEEAVYARLVTVSRRNDLALLEATSPMGLPPLTISGNPAMDAGAVTSVGYPQNVDRAQGLEMEDIFRAQPPVKSTGFLSGRRPSRGFDTLLHTAPIARGSSGGPLLDECGRVVGVNSFGAESGGADAEFFFAISTRELLPFLRANDVAPRVNSMPCRSIAELEEEERTREQRLRAAAEAETRSEEQALARRREETRRAIEFAIISERENRMALAFVLLLVALAAGGFGWRAHEQYQADFEDLCEGNTRGRTIGFGVALLALAGATAAWLSRPGYQQVNERLEDRLREDLGTKESANGAATIGGTLTCRLDPQRSRITGEALPSLSFTWSEQGCVDGRTQYGLSGGVWTRVLVPGSEAAVSVNRLDPAAGELLIERYLLDREAMSEARALRGQYQAPSCTAGAQSAREFGGRQEALVASLPDRPNERLVYNCTPDTAG